VTSDQQRAAIKAMIDRHTKTVSTSKEAARDFLIKGGFYTKEGHLAEQYGGEKKKSA
jgi:hypothetical protein